MASERLENNTENKVSSENKSKAIDILPCPVHSSLVRPILLAGADRSLVLINLTCIALLLFGVGLHVMTLLVAILCGVLGHGILMRLAKYDPQFSEVYLRHIRYKDSYASLTSVLVRARSRS